MTLEVSHYSSFSKKKLLSIHSSKRV